MLIAICLQDDCLIKVRSFLVTLSIHRVMSGRIMKAPFLKLRLLFGTLKARSFEWLVHEPHEYSSPLQLGQIKEAILVSNKIVQAGAKDEVPLVVYPQQGQH